ncbi:MAG: reverse transcriptase domain-containing protein, partial [Chloroflexota bacterium]
VGMLHATSLQRNQGDPMFQQFFDNFLDYSRRRDLFGYNGRVLWGNLFPPNYNYNPNNTFGVRYRLSETAYLEPWDELERGVLPPRFRYRHFTVPKKDGSPRELAEPGAALKAMQYKIIENFLAHAKPHHSAVGYRRGHSIADHAWAHAGARTIITADIADFFPSTKRYRVRQYWKDHRYVHNSQEITLLTNLTTYRGSLPQGAPTSPMLSNLVNVELDRRLHKLVTESGGAYTRYADDIAFSWRARARPPSDFEGVVRRVLREYGYRLHSGDKGWAVWSRKDEPEITGVRLTRSGGVDLPEPMLRHMRELARSGDDPSRLAGYQGYRQMIRGRRWR